jgi:hypothetical protein
MAFVETVPFQDMLFRFHTSRLLGNFEPLEFLRARNPFALRKKGRYKILFIVARFEAHHVRAGRKKGTWLSEKKEDSPGGYAWYVRRRPAVEACNSYREEVALWWNNAGTLDHLFQLGFTETVHANSRLVRIALWII